MNLCGQFVVEGGSPVFGNGSSENFINRDIADVREVAQDFNRHSSPAVLYIADIAGGYMKLCSDLILCQSLFNSQLFDSFTQTLKIKIAIIHLAVCLLSVFKFSI